jgi:5-methylcytosine-specific restriction endonuclease McrBC GTP-binding regulatory subunit McrB
MSSEKKSTSEDTVSQIRSDIEDLKFKMDAILTALVLPHLGENRKEIAEKINKIVKSELGRNIWNSINGERSLADIGKKVKRKPQVVLNYISRWEQEIPPLVYVSRTKDNSKIYRRIFDIKLRKPKTELIVEKIDTGSDTQQTTTGTDQRM